MVMAQALFKTLKQQHPDCEIDVVAPKWSLPILKRMPEVRHGIAVDVQHGEFSFFKRWKLGKQLRKNHYTHAIVIPRSWKSAIISFAAKVPIRTGYRGEMRYGLLNDIRVLNKDILKQTVQRYVAHAGKNNPQTAPVIPFPALTIDHDNQQHLLKKLHLKLNRPVICIMPGAEYGPAKQWSVEYYRELAVKQVDAGYQIWVIGSEKDRAAGNIISPASDDAIINLCGKTQLADTVDLFACAEAAVCNDSGLMHIAAASGVKVHVIYGSSTPDYTPPLTTDDKKKIYYLGLSCSPCFKRECPLGHAECLTEIHVDEIVDSINK